MQALLPGRAMSAERIAQAERLLKEYKDGKAALEKRVIDNEQWYKLRHWEQVKRSENRGDPEPASAWLLNSIANKHADAMDNYPQPNVLPREEGDRADAELLASVLPAVLEQNEFEQTYSDMWWYKLKTGTGVYGVFWRGDKLGGLGDVDIRFVDVLNLFWEPGVTDIQKSRHLFHVDLVDRELMAQRFPALAREMGGASVDVARYRYDDSVDDSRKVAVVDWYYKLDMGGRMALHFCKFCGGHVLYASEDDPRYAQRGYYDHGRYPFVFDVLFPEAGTPAGFGYVDVCKSPQLYIDKLDQVLLKKAVMATRPRFFVRGDGVVNEAEFADWQKDFVHYAGSGSPGDSIVPITLPSLDGNYINVRQMKVEELKETSGNRDFSQGGVSAGVTAASAIAALQEAGSKLSRDMLKASYRAFAQVGYLCVDLMRQFYTEARMFRVVGRDGATRFVRFCGRSIAGRSVGDAFSSGYRTPCFDIRVTAQRASPFSTVAQNERAKELFGLGFFRPDMADQALAALEMMQFEGVEVVRERVQRNGTLYHTLMQAAPLMLQLARELDRLKGTAYAPQVAKLLGARLKLTDAQDAGNAQTRLL